jgi:hypothetical protein
MKFKKLIIIKNNKSINPMRAFSFINGKLDPKLKPVFNIDKVVECFVD